MHKPGVPTTYLTIAMDMMRVAVPALFVVLSGGAGAILLIGARADGRLRRRVRNMPLTSCGDLAALTLPMPAKVAGEAIAGPQGTLSAPLSGRPCIWFQVRVQYVTFNIDPRRSKRKTVYEDRATAPFGVTDDTGQLTVLPTGKPVDYLSAAYAGNRLKTIHQNILVGRHHDPYHSILKLEASEGVDQRVYQEWIVPVGQRLTAFGEVAQDLEYGLVMRRSARETLLAAPMTEEDLDAAMRRDIRYLRAFGGLFAAVALVVLIACIAVIL